jgi:penicillin-binding protein A
MLAAAAFAIGAVLGARHAPSPAYALADRFVTAWTHKDYVRMYSDVDASSRRSIPVSEFASAYQQALTTATATRLRMTGTAHAVAGGYVSVPVRIDTRLFGTLSLDFTLRTVEEAGAGTRIAWSRSDTFPGLRPGELLSRRMRMPRRATLLARDGSVLAESPPGPAPVPSQEGTRNSPLGNLADAVLGTVGPVPASRRQELEEQGVPPEATVGLSGLELALDDRLRGIPGGELLAGGRLLAYAAPHAAPPLRTTV